MFVRTPPGQPTGVGRSVWDEAAESPQFLELRSRLLRFVVPATIGFLGWIMAFAALNAWAPELLSVKVVGDMTLVIVLAVGQFVSTFALTVAYVRYADRRLDPLADEIRDRLEGGQR